MRRGRLSGGEGWSLSRSCPKCGKDDRDCRCAQPMDKRGPTPPLRLRIEKRAGKPVTVCAAEGLAPAELRDLARDLKILCGSGGTVRGQTLELQGDHRDRLRGHLTGRGYRVKG